MIRLRRLVSTSDLSVARTHKTFAASENTMTTFASMLSQESIMRVAK